MAYNFIEKIHSLTAEQRLLFYEVFAHNLTVSIRAFWSAPELSDKDKIDCIKWINELLHSVTSKIYVTRLNLHEWTEESTWETIQSIAELNDLIRDQVYAALDYSFRAVMHEQNDQIA